MITYGHAKRFTGEHRRWESLGKAFHLTSLSTDPFLLSPNSMSLGFCLLDNKKPERETFANGLIGVIQKHAVRTRKRWSVCAASAFLFNNRSPWKGPQGANLYEAIFYILFTS